ncbi:hypothetical protein F8388_019119 [Cannabis sativa]|uniref:Uncharacterized protein n=2 Tax=Cannabis sativa TaxID=3483 RepID=A0A7J6FCH5_CANSA|nr:hypothetical protein G4B88_029260 [Cannabis sativa]KAF4368402.1 hypothetical protein F8388_019119 [Cannabis sativa]
MAMMLRGHGSAAIGFSSFPSSSSSSSSSSYLNQNAKPSVISPTIFHLEMVCKQLTIRTSNYACFAVQESSTSTVATDENKEAKPAKKAAPAKPKAKAPVKALPEMMKEEVIPSLKSILEAQDDLEGSFAKKGNPYSFWAFFPDGVLTGPKGFSLSSYGGEVSTVEPFLIDEKKITARHVVFWVEKRLAAQGIIPVWND